MNYNESLPSLQAKAHDYQATALNLAIGLSIGKLSLGICQLPWMTDYKLGNWKFS